MVKKVPKKNKNNYNDNNSVSLTEYTVEKIINDRFIKKNGKIIHEFLVKWENYPNPTWEPESNLYNCKEILQEYITPSYNNHTKKNNYNNDIKSGNNNNKEIINNKKYKSINKETSIINTDLKKENKLIPFKMEKYEFKIFEDSKYIKNGNNIKLYSKIYKKNLILKIIRDLQLPFYITKTKIMHLKIDINNDNLINKVIVLGLVRKKSKKIKNYIKYIAKLVENSIMSFMKFDKNNIK